VGRLPLLEVVFHAVEGHVEELVEGLVEGPERGPATARLSSND
jgi:hypothetical protein